MPGLPGADAHLEATVSEHRQRVRFPTRVLQAGRSGEAYTHVPHPQVGKGGRDGQRGGRRRLPLRDVRASAAWSIRCRRYGAPGLATSAGLF